MMGVTEQRAPRRRVTQVPVLVGPPEPAQVIQSLEICGGNLLSVAQGGNCTLPLCIQFL